MIDTYQGVFNGGTTGVVYGGGYRTPVENSNILVKSGPTRIYEMFGGFEDNNTVDRAMKNTNIIFVGTCYGKHH